MLLSQVEGACGRTSVMVDGFEQVFRSCVEHMKVEGDMEHIDDQEEERDTECAVVPEMRKQDTTASFLIRKAHVVHKLGGLNEDVVGNDYSEVEVAVAGLRMGLAESMVVIVDGKVEEVLALELVVVAVEVRNDRARTWHPDSLQLAVQC